MKISVGARPHHATTLCALLATVAVTATGCVKPDAVGWLDKTEMPDQHPSPLSFPGAVAFDSAWIDTSRAAAFARTQDLLREAGAVSMLEGVLTAMPEAKETITGQSVATSIAAVQPGAPTTGSMGGMNHAMPTPATSRALQIPGADLGSADYPQDVARCARSLRVADVPGKGRVAVWWSKRDKGRVFLVAAWQLTGNSAPDTIRAWRGPVNVDTLDQGAGDANAVERGAVGCDRAAPGLAVDPQNDYVHVAYALNAPEGAGVFYAHQMDPRAPFESPIVMMYGDRRMGAARVATSGDVVAVVYEDPNAPLGRGRIGLAISRTSGHSFEPRVNASRTGRAVDPYVLIRGRAAVVGWTEVDSTVSATAAFRLRRATIR
ncbi:MAG: hypothetical protein ABJB74_13830 [Gemmatimonas sp.]